MTPHIVTLPSYETPLFWKCICSVTRIGVRSIRLIVTKSAHKQEECDASLLSHHVGGVVRLCLSEGIKHISVMRATHKRTSLKIV